MAKQSGDQEENSIDGDLSQSDLPMLNYFFQRYPPASNFKDSNLTMSTEEIQDNLYEHSGTLFERDKLYNWLLQRGYHQETLGEGKFLWLIGTSEKF